MVLTPGTLLGPYEVVSALGAGGMGEVYRALDTRLGRTVAVKVLARECAADADSQIRFEREARAIATLDHPHICSIYDVGKSGDTHYLVMPHLDGETLAARLKKGALPLPQSLEVAAQIASALDKAHRQGIVHRDLKPANVMLTKTGAKLLDFGLAKLRRPSGAVALSAMAGTVTAAPETARGTILGTVEYMAPEQLEGLDADARSDIWALGIVLYEMTTGTHPFASATPASIISAILRDTPPAISTRQPLAPRALDRLIDHCLAKDPDQRWQSAGDVGRILESIEAPETADVVARRRQSGWRERAVWIATTCVLLIGLAMVALSRKPSSPSTETLRLSVNAPEPAVFTPQQSSTVSIPQFALSPNGGSLTFVAGPLALRPTLWVRQLGELEARSLPGTEDARDPFWSPDGRWIGFFDGQGALKRVAVSGETVQTIARGVTDQRRASWGPDDTILIGTGYGPIQRVPATGGILRAVTHLDPTKDEGSHRYPFFLPDGRHFLFTARSAHADHREIYVGSLDDDSRHPILPLDVDVQYAATGYLVYLDGDTLLAQPFDRDRFVLGQPTAIEAHVGQSSRGNSAFSVSRDGTIAYAAAAPRTGQLTWFDRSGNAVGTVGEADRDYADFRLSRDDKRLATTLVDPKQSVADIWLYDLVRGGNSRLTFGPTLNAAAVWSPQDDRLAFRTNRKGLLEIYQKSTVAGGNEEPLLGEDIARRAGIGLSTLIATDWSADGRLALTAGVPSDIWVLTTADPTKLTNVVQSPGDQMHGNFSPDGSLIAYTSNESGRFEVYVQSLQQGARKWTISVNGGYEPRWRADGRELYYLAEDEKLMAVPVSPGADPFGVPRALFRAPVHAGVNSLRTHYVPNRDGSRFLIQRRNQEVAPTTITIVLHGSTALKR